MKYIKLFILFFLIIILPIGLSASNNIVDQLKEGGKIVIVRHAYAPGSGDPDNFLIKDCSTQRNLNKTGIEQSKIIGNFFKKNKIPIDTVLSSEWCRCKDTALHAFKNFETNTFLNSFYGSKYQNNKDQQIMELKDYIKKWHGKKNLILITHYVVIKEILNVSPKSGEMIIFDIEFNVIGKLENKL
jgi:phosphohistidine phosphatase SixA|tara:strand:+ start:93 stop:650 length:558 start_codon:yes stop_codon:yes gene_type:complete